MLSARDTKRTKLMKKSLKSIIIFIHVNIANQECWNRKRKRRREKEKERGRESESSPFAKIARMMWHHLNANVRSVYQINARQIEIVYNENCSWR